MANVCTMWVVCVV